MAVATDGSNPGTDPGPEPAPDTTITHASGAKPPATPPPDTWPWGDRDAEAAAIRPGLVLADRFQVEEQLGKGGMGSVWRVKHLDLKIHRALKFIDPRLAADPTYRARFVREAQVMAKFRHPNAVTVHDSGCDARGVAFIHMEYIPGEPLVRVMKKGQPLSLEYTASVLHQLCDVLQYAHDQDIVHRDLKPSNLMLDASRPPGKELKVLDFGIAKILTRDEAGDDAPTIAGAPMGTPPYSSPEQLGGNADHRSDLYSVGVLLYEMLTGSRPFSGSLTRVHADTLVKPPPRFAEISPAADVPPAIEAIVLRCLEKQPEDRPQSARELAEAFQQALSPIAPPPPVVPPWSFLRWVVAASIVAMAGVGLGAVATQSLPALIGWFTTTRVGVEPERRVPDSPRPTMERDGRKYALYGGQFYLPDGYEPEDPKDFASDDWPQVLVRKADRVRFIRVPGGTFSMGGIMPMDAVKENIPVHEVTLSGFYIQQFEVTHAEMERYWKTLDSGSRHLLEKWHQDYENVFAAQGESGTEWFPATFVAWELADHFSAAMNGFLPTEAQWEYAARSGGQKRPIVWDEDRFAGMPIGKLAHINNRADPRDGRCQRPVGSFEADAALDGRVFDMTGNVAEWTRDVYTEYTTQAAIDPHPTVGANNDDVVVRGGSYMASLEARHTTFRSDLRRSDMLPHVGFRLVLEGFEASKAQGR